MKTVVVATATNVVVASAWRDLLRSAGIDAQLTGSNWESLFPMMSQLASIAVLVPETDAARARELIDEMERAGAARTPGDGGPEPTDDGAGPSGGNGEGPPGDRGATPED